MRSPQALLVPAIMLLLLGALTAALVTGLRSGRVGPRAAALLWRVGAALVGVGLVLVFGYAWLGQWIGYALVTPLILAGGAGLLAVTGRSRGHPLSVLVFLSLVGVVAAFWATATLAQWTGRGIAENTARHLDELPAVLLDSTESLYVNDTVTREKVLKPRYALAPPEGQTYLYRYYGLRLLAQAGDKMFLVPERWTSAGSTLVFDMSDVRVKFRFVDQPP
jgi:hypothetical protein